MKKRLFINLPVILLVAITLGLTSCNKDEEDDGAALSKTQMLTAHTWKFSSVSGGNADINEFYSAFFTNATYTFKADKTYAIKTIFGNDNGTWAFNDAETKIVFDPGTADESSNDIVTLTSSTLEFKETEGSVTFTIKFVK